MQTTEKMGYSMLESKGKKTRVARGSDLIPSREPIPAFEFQGEEKKEKKPAARAAAPARKGGKKPSRRNLPSVMVKMIKSD